jgi:catechol 2,3-dioxygenase-like lactoylglutathione lyase family enzyme
MGAQLDHTIVWCRDKKKSAAFFSEMLGLSPPSRFGPFLVVDLANGVSLDFHEKDGAIAAQHYAFLITESDFEQVHRRVLERRVAYWADPGRERPGEINRNDGGRGMYFADPDGHLLEVITRRYGSGA